MKKKKSQIINIPYDLFNEITMYCDLNKIEDYEKLTLGCLKGGFVIEKFGRTPIKAGKEIVEKEVIKEVEKIVEVLVEKIVEVPVEKIVEIQVEKIITKTEYVTDDKEISHLLSEIERLKNELEIKPKTDKVKVEDNNKIQTLQSEIKVLKSKIVEYEDVLDHFKKFSDNKTTHLRSSKLNDEL